MSIISGMAASGCIIGVVMCAVDMMKPDEKNLSYIKLVFSVIFILSIISVFKESDISYSCISYKRDAYEISEEAVKEDMEHLVQKNTEAAFGSILKSKNILYDKIYVKVNINEDNRINISDIYIFSEDYPEAREALINEIGGDVMIYEGKQ